MELGLSSSRLSAAGLDASSAHLADRLCSTNEERDGTVWYQVDRKEGSCGNTLKVKMDVKLNECSFSHLSPVSFV